MSDFEKPPLQREFRCSHCSGLIRVPASLPPTTAPCPHCGSTITSPGPAPSASQDQSAAPKPVLDENPILPTEPIPAAQSSRVEPAPRGGSGSRSPLIPILLGTLLIGLVAGITVILVSREMGRNVGPLENAGLQETESVRESNYIRTGWKKDAYRVLGSFMNAGTVAAKIPHVLDGDKLRPRMDDFYGGGVINDSDTPAETFSVYELSEEDRARGLFMLVYDQPPQFSMRDFFRPLAPLEVQYGIEEADILLSSVARMSNFAMDPVRVHAFFRKTPSGLKLDWEVFAQTKYRTLRNFIELPETGLVGTFRAFVAEDVPDRRHADGTTRTYRITDPANSEDSTRIVVPVDSKVGRILSPINWRGTSSARPITRTATLDLEWTGDEARPELIIRKFRCWEFLGLGGRETEEATETTVDP